MPIQSIRLSDTHVALLKSRHPRAASASLERILTAYLPRLDALPAAGPYPHHIRVRSYSLPVALSSLLKEVSAASRITISEAVRRCLNAATPS